MDLSYCNFIIYFFIMETDGKVFTNTVVSTVVV